MVQSITESEKRLLSVLLNNSRLSAAMIAEEINKGRNWVTRTIKRLVKTGVIRGYVTVLDPAQVYAERNTILLIKTNPRELGVSHAILEMPELESLDGISGEHSLLGLFRFRGSGAFEEFLDRVDSVVSMSGTGKYQLVQVLSTYKTNGFTLQKHRSRETSVSSKDWVLMSTIYRHSPSEDHPLPLSQGEIGKRMNPPLSQPAVSKAMQRLEKRHAIVGYTVDIDFSQYGLPVKFFLQVRSKPGTVAETAHVLSAMDEIWDLHRTSEDYSLFATVRTKDIDGYNQFLRKLY
ncbi:MAG: Lrp/AsnC family transcriptional regulator, partial [Candidatus Thorarchaeota archaeon]